MQEQKQDDIVQCSVIETSSTVMLDSIQYFERLFHYGFSSVNS